jgi:hypothetical protein
MGNDLPAVSRLCNFYSWQILLFKALDLSSRLLFNFYISTPLNIDIDTWRKGSNGFYFFMTIVPIYSSSVFRISGEDGHGASRVMSLPSLSIRIKAGIIFIW